MDPIAAVRPYVTLMGGDPTWRTAPTPATPAPESFRLSDPKDREPGLTLEELAGSDQRVGVVGHPVAYDEDRQLWYADIEIDPGDSYFPFVRLALVRYQPKSVTTADADVKLSRVVHADFVQLAPDRTATIAQAATNKRQVNVTVTGLSGIVGDTGTQPNIVEVTIETRAPGATGVGAWLPATQDVYPLKHTFVRGGGVVWSGPATLPADRGSEPMRVVIREYELIAVDPSAISAMAMVAPQYGRHLIYADAIEI
jgi:hypothetical protein